MNRGGLAGLLVPGEGERSVRVLAGALDGPSGPETRRLGPLVVGWRTPGPLAGGTDRTLCLLDGRIDGLADPTETLAITFERAGEAVLDLLRGEYVLLLFDRERRRGIIIRDPLGAHPLHIAARGSGLAFASEIRDLIALLPARPAPDDIAVSHRLARTPLGGDRTLFRGIRRLLPGHLLALEEDRWTTRRWWAPRYRGPGRGARADVVAGLRTATAAAVARRLEPQGSGVLLSGGLDSATVAALAVEGGGRPLAAYSLVFPDHPASDESARIATVREHLGLAGTVRAHTSASPMDSAREFMAAWEEPPAGPNGFLWEPLMGLAASEGTRVLLDGEGGDELFGCSVYLLADRLRAGRVGSALALARRIPGMGPHPPPRLVGRALVRYGARGALPRSMHLALRAVRRRRGRDPAPLLRPWAARLHAAEEDAWSWKRLDGPRWWGSLVDSLVAAPEALGAALHFRREGALAGVELRHPLRDLELVEHVLRLPPAMAFDPVFDRPLIREAMGSALPDAARLNTSKPFFNEVLSGAFAVHDRQAIRTLLSGPRPEVTRWVRSEVLDSLLDGSGKTLAPGSLELWSVAVMEAWLQAQGDPRWFA